MIFSIKGKDYRGRNAVEIVREIASDSPDCPACNGSIREFLLWSLNQQQNGIPPRELNLSERLEDEPLALSYLCLLDEYGIGILLSEANELEEPD
jgi:hypothetical protein